MDQELLNKILSCSSLPSLPAVAVRVLELTGDPDVKMDELAAEIQLDQALSAKILRTVNSSFYSLREPCSTIRKALVLLGLSPVKSLVLGFSLVSSVEQASGDAFDWVAYWRRGLYSAIGAKFIAEQALPRQGDEAFLGGLLMDVGMVALYRALGTKYERVLLAADGDHDLLVKFELEQFETTHAEIGAMLCEHWRMPGELVLPVKYHEKPTAAPVDCMKLAQCVWLGRQVHDVLTDEVPRDALDRLYRRSKEWFGLESNLVDVAVRKAGESAKEVSKLFSLETGGRVDPEGVIAEAHEQMRQMTRQDPRGSYGAEGLAGLVADDSDGDPLTGAIGPNGFDQALRRAFTKAKGGQADLSLVQVLVEGLDEAGTEHGQLVQDEIVIGLVSLLNKHFEPLGGVACRIAQPIFSVVLPGASRSMVQVSGGEFGHELTSAVASWLPGGCGADEIRVSVGMAIMDNATRARFDEPNKLVMAATKALQESRADGSGRVRKAA